MRSRHFAPTGNALGFDDAFRLLHVSSGRVLAIEPDGAAGGGGGGGSRRGGGRISRSSLRMSGAPPSVAGLDPEVPATKPVSLTTSYDPAPRQVEWRGGTVAATAAPPGERRPRRPRRAPRPPSFVHTRRARSSWWSLSTRCATWGDSSSSTVTSSSGTGPPAATSTSSRSVRPTPSGTLALAPSCTPALASSDAIDPPPSPLSGGARAGVAGAEAPERQDLLLQGPGAAHDPGGGGGGGGGQPHRADPRSVGRGHRRPTAAGRRVVAPPRRLVGLAPRRRRRLSQQAALAALEREHAVAPRRPRRLGGRR